MEEKVILAVACLTVRCQLRLCFIVRLPAMTFLAHMTFYRMTPCLITFSLKRGCPIFRALGSDGSETVENLILVL